MSFCFVTKQNKLIMYNMTSGFHTVFNETIRRIINPECWCHTRRCFPLTSFVIDSLNVTYGIRHCLIAVGSITEVKQLGLPGAVYTATSCTDVVSWGSENHVNQMARLTDFELDVKEPQWT